MKGGDAYHRDLWQKDYYSKIITLCPSFPELTEVCSKKMKGKLANE